MPESPPRPAPATAAPDLTAHGPMLRRYLFVLGAAADRVDDLAQEVFAAVLERGFEDRGPGALAAFLRGVAKNMLLRQWHGARRRREVELGDEVWRDANGGDEDDDARVDALRACVDGLPERGRRMLDRAYRDGAGRRELAAEFSMAPDGIKTALRRLRDGLRDCVERRMRGER